MSARKGKMDETLSERAADEAGSWDARLRSPACTDVDRERFEHWREADPAHRLAFERLQSVVAGLRQEISRADVRALRDAALNAPRQRWWARLLWDEDRARPGKRSFALVAAIAVLAIGVAGWAMLTDAARSDAFNASSAQLYETRIGQRSTVTLQDGSITELNAQTRIKVAFTSDRRSVELTEGQAIFRVARDPLRPFVVRAGNRDIVAIGTAFDVRLDATTVRVTVIEGKISVKPSSAQAGAAAPHLAPGQQLIVSRVGSDASHDRSHATVHANSADDEVLIRSIDVGKVTGWRDGRVYLDDLALQDAVAEMNKYSHVQIEIRDSQLATLRVNGMFRAGKPDGFTAALEQYFPIRAQRESDTLIVLTQRR
jgi:transmembrane sensor